MKKRWLAAVVLIVAAIAIGLGVSAGAGAAPTAQGGGSGILKVGTVSYIDSFNPFNYIEAQAFDASIMVYPQLVQYEYGKHGYYAATDWSKSWTKSKDGKTWTFHLYPNTKWSDGKPLTAADAAWTINTTLKYANGATAVAASALAHVKNAKAPNATTLVIHYAAPVGNVLAQLEQFFVLPKHVYAKYAATKGGKGLKTFHPEQHMPVVTAGAYTVTQYQKKGTSVFRPYKG